jgi:ABC-2 type transport system ATP-binding protein
MAQYPLDKNATDLTGSLSSMGTTGAPAVVVTRELTRQFGPLTAVDRLSLSVFEGEIFGLLGPNGAGKTTTIKMLTTLLPPSSGSGSIAGFEITRSPAEVRAHIGYVPQLISADPGISGYENLWVFAGLYGIPRSERNPRIRDALNFIGLGEYADVLVRQYSGGMIRRLEIAQAMLSRPRVLFMDEPTVGLDPIARDAVWLQIEQLREKYGATVLLTTHYMQEADRLCDRLAIFHHGAVVALGSPRELKEGLGRPDATLEDAFVHYAGEGMDSGGSFRDTRQTRSTSVRLR